MVRLIPRDEKYFDLFNTMVEHVEQGAALLKKVFADFDHYQDYAHEIKVVEHRCDEVTHNIVRKLNQSFITPIDREDIHALASALDDVLDSIDSTANRMVLFNVDRPPDIARQVAEVIYHATQEIGRAVTALGKNSSALEHCVEIHSLENQADVLYRQAVAQLFVNPTDPYFVIKWKELYDRLEKCVDKCEDVANVVEAIVLKNA